MDVVNLHKKDLAAGQKKLHSLTPQSNEWWEVKDKLKKFEIAFSQSLNLAVEMCKGNLVEMEDYQMIFYKHLTAPYRALPKGTSNIDDEITIPLDPELTEGQR